MPVGTKGTIKGLTSRQLDRPELSPQIILSNTYHLALQPGTDLLAELGGQRLQWTLGGERESVCVCVYVCARARLCA